MAGKARFQNLRRALVEQRKRRRVGIDDRVAGGVNDHDRFRRDLEQQPITGFGMPQPDIVALHRLLGIDQPLLHRRQRAQIAADHDEAILASDIDGRIEHRDILAAGRRMIDLAPARRFPRGRVVQQLPDLRRGSRRSRSPRASNPSTGPGASSSSDSSSLLNATSRMTPCPSTTTATSVAAAIKFAADSAPRSPSNSFGDLNTCTRANILHQPVILHSSVLPTRLLVVSGRLSHGVRHRPLAAASSRTESGLLSRQDDGSLRAPRLAFCNSGARFGIRS